MNETYRFGGGPDQTTLVPLVALAILVGIVLILALPRRRLIIPFLLLAFLIPSGQTLVLGGVHLFVFRILIFVGCGRVIAAKLSGKQHVLGGRGFNTLDRLFLCWALTRAAAFMLLYGSPAVVNQFAFLWDSLGGYFFLRFAIQDEHDIRTATKTFAVIAIFVAACMLYERYSLTNVFGAIGSRPVPDIREGKARSQGPFSHAILAGVFAATITPLFLRLWLASKKDRAIATVALFGAAAMVLTSASSTTFGAYVAGIFAVGCWPLRRNMRMIRWGIVAAIVLLAFVMKAPVWFLLARIDLVGGSSGYHRAMLIDQSIRRFGDWWLLGANNNQSWGWDMWDIQNQFLAEALRGGFAALVFFTMLVSRAFGWIGRARRAAKGRDAQLIWLLGAVMFAHVVAFFGADYFDQTRFWWYASLAIISAATAPFLRKTSEPCPTEVPESGSEWGDVTNAFPITAKG